MPFRLAAPYQGCTGHLGKIMVFWLLPRKKWWGLVLSDSPRVSPWRRMLVELVEECLRNSILISGVSLYYMVARVLSSCSFIISVAFLSISYGLVTVNAKMVSTLEDIHKELSNKVLREFRIEWCIGQERSQIYLRGSKKASGRWWPMSFILNYKWGMVE